MTSETHVHATESRWFRYCRIGLTLFSYIMVSLSITAFLATISMWGLPERDPHFAREWEFPLSDPTDAVADEDGRVYVGLGFYSRIQVYDAKGRFLHGFFVPTGGGEFRLRFDEKRVLNAVTARGNRIHRYDERGVLLGTERYRDREFYVRVAAEHRTGFVDAEGRRYVIRNRLWDPRVCRIEPTGELSLEIRTPVFLTPFIGPLPCWSTLFVFSVLSHWSRKRRQARTAEDKEATTGEPTRDLRLARAYRCAACGEKVRMRSFRMYPHGRPTECPACGSGLLSPAQALSGAEASSAPEGIHNFEGTKARP